MKTRNIWIAALLLMGAAGHAAAQQTGGQPQKTRIETRGDSIIIRKGAGDLRIKVYEQQGDESSQEEVEIYEGVWLEKVDADKRNFLDALPFIPGKKRKNDYEPHVSGIYIGFSRLADNFLGFGASPQARLDLSASWEFGFNLLCTYHQFKKNPHWGINAGVSWGYRSFSIDGDYALLKQDGYSFLQSGQAMAAAQGIETDGAAYYSKSRLRHFFFRIPLQIEWQQRWNRSRVFFNIGPEFEIRHGVKSFTRVQGGKKQTAGKGMYVQPVGVNLLVQAGYGNLGIYLRYTANRMFQKDKGMEVNPYSFGLAWYW